MYYKMITRDFIHAALYLYRQDNLLFKLQGSDRMQRRACASAICLKLLRNGVPDRVFEQLQRDRMVHIRVEAYSLDSTGIKVHPDGVGVLKRTVQGSSAGPGAAGTPDFTWLPRMPGQPLPARSPPATRTTPCRCAGCRTG